MARSGTTLTNQILASHPLLDSAGETQAIQHSLLTTLNAVCPQTSDRPLREQVGELTRKLVDKARVTCLKKLTQHDSQSEFVIDKLPGNYLHLGWIATLFPSAPIIHCKRGYLSIALSCWLTAFGSIRWANDADDIWHRIAEYERAVTYWKSLVPNPWLDVEYEQTVQDVELFTRQALEFLGLPWDDQCLEFHNQNRPVNTASVKQVRQPIYTRSLKRWGKYVELLPALLDR